MYDRAARNGCRNAGISGLCEGLCLNTKLKTLQIGILFDDGSVEENEVDELVTEGLAQTIRRNSHLEALDLCGQPS